MVVFKLYTFKSEHKRIKRLTEAIYRPLDIFRQSSNEEIRNIIEDTLYYENILENIVEWLVIGLDLGLLSVLLINFGEIPLRGAFPFDTSHLPFYVIATIIQTGTASVFSITLAAMNELIFSYIRWINSQFRILTIAYEENFVQDILAKIINSESASFESFRNSNHYGKNLYLNDIVTELNSIFNSTMLVQVSSSCCIICLTCFQLVMGDLKSEYKLLFFFGGALTELFNFCWFGSELISVSDCVSDGVWLSGWEKNLDFEVKSLMLMSLITAKNPLEMRAGNFFVISLETFITVSKCNTVK
ncbi:odorant receptor 82a-like [Chelonus insularis]|uniref:odorant receptor 82a-like n=1 Tax=Chelonus insularis TaxID=460826 RepID=UPI001588E167|nr:odorant receptor 82a-like [Chelonus insularis]